MLFDILLYAKVKTVWFNNSNFLILDVNGFVMKDIMCYVWLSLYMPLEQNLGQ